LVHVAKIIELVASSEKGWTGRTRST